MYAPRVNSPLEKQVIKIFTPFAFEKFKEEYLKASQYVIANQEGHDFVLRYYEDDNNKFRRVFWDGKIAMCSCKQFEFIGILCRHILRVFLQTDCHKIPSIYLLIRWQLQDHIGGSIDDMQGLRDMDDIGSTNAYGDYFEDICASTQEQNLGGNNVIDGEPILCPPKSITKGGPKNKRLKSGKETAKRTRPCFICRAPGHYGNNCPENKQNEIVPNGKPKKKKKVELNDKDVNPVFSVKC